MAIKNHFEESRGSSVAAGPGVAYPPDPPLNGPGYAKYILISLLNKLVDSHARQSVGLAGLEVGRYETVCHTGTSLDG